MWDPFDLERKVIFHKYLSNELPFRQILYDPQRMLWFEWQRMLKVSKIMNGLEKVDWIIPVVLKIVVGSYLYEK